MIVFPNAKVNLGLQILRKRADGFHEISSLFYPIPLCDVLEFVPSSKDSFESSGILIPGTGNLVMDALDLVRKKHDIPPIGVHLHKHIPIGAGLGGGSADAAFMINALCDEFEVRLSLEEKEEIAAELGSDCAFFIRNQPAMASGRGEVLEPFHLDLSGKYMVVHYPGIHISTARAYAGITPRDNRTPIDEILSQPISNWSGLLTNDFQAGICQSYPEVAQAISVLENAGARYAAMTGSGSAVFGIFDRAAEVEFLSGSTFAFTLD